MFPRIVRTLEARPPKIANADFIVYRKSDFNQYMANIDLYSYKVIFITCFFLASTLLNTKASRIFP